MPTPPQLPQNKVEMVVSPMGGVNQVLGREAQSRPDPQHPPTCWDANNVLPFDVYGRGRVSQRFGISKAWGTQLGGSTNPAFIQGILAVNFAYANSSPVQNAFALLLPSTAVNPGNFPQATSTFTVESGGLFDGFVENPRRSTGNAWSGNIGVTTEFLVSFVRSTAGNIAGPGFALYFSDQNTNAVAFVQITVNGVAGQGASTFVQMGTFFGSTSPTVQEIIVPGIGFISSPPSTYYFTVFFSPNSTQSQFSATCTVAGSTLSFPLSPCNGIGSTWNLFATIDSPSTTVLNPGTVIVTAHS